MPAGVRVEVVEGDEGVPSRLVGGSLKTLLYMTQLAAISQDPWFSRVQSPGIADHVAIDLDPMPDAPFARVLDVARWVRDELATLGAAGYPKTSGADGLHIFIPLPPGTPYEAGPHLLPDRRDDGRDEAPEGRRPWSAPSARADRRWCTWITCRTSRARRSRARTARARASTRARPRRSRGTRSTAASIAATSPSARFPDGCAEVGDLWAQLRRSKGVKLRAVERYGR